jgi:hypothetical protein
MNDWKRLLREDVNQHIEEFAAAFALKTQLDPTQIVMKVQAASDTDGVYQKIWFEPMEPKTPHVPIGNEQVIPSKTYFRALVESSLDNGRSLVENDEEIIAAYNTAFDKVKELLSRPHISILQPNSNESQEPFILNQLYGILKDMRDVHKKLDRSEKARRYAVSITELEKAIAYFETFVVNQ